MKCSSDVGWRGYTKQGNHEFMDSGKGELTFSYQTQPGEGVQQEGEMA